MTATTPDRTRLLVVDDDDDGYALIRELLSAVGDARFDVQWASSHDEGLALLEKNEHDIVLLDYHLGERTGLDLLRDARARGSRVPAVLLADLVDRDVDLAAMRAGAADFIVKSQMNERLLERSIRYALAESRTLDALRRSETRFRALIEQVPEAVLVHVDGVLAYVNPATLAYLGYAAADHLIGRGIADLVVDAGRDVMLDTMLTAPAAHGSAPLQVVRLRRADGGVVSAEMSVLAISFDGQPAVLHIARDVTERLETQARLILSDRLASLGTLAAGVAHQVNNPLTYVLSNIGFVSEELTRLRATAPSGLPLALIDVILSALDDAQQGADRVRAIVGDLRTFASSEEEKHGPVNVRRTLEVSLHMAENEIRHRAKLIVELDDTPDVDANSGRLHQVFLNLLLNAAYAIPEASVVSDHLVRVSLRGEGDRVVVSISDTGAGMPPDVKSRIFDPFFTTKPVGIGTGLGLFVCHNIVAGMGGEIRVESEVGRGTTFHVALPTVRAPRRRSSRGMPAVAAPRRGRILVIDDEPKIGDALRRALMHEHDFVCLTEAEQALELLRRGERYDVVLCDVTTPALTGMDLHERLLREFPDLAEKTIFFTGGAFTQRATDFLARVPNARLQKPIDVGKLRAMIRARVR